MRINFTKLFFIVFLLSTGYSFTQFRNVRITTNSSFTRQPNEVTIAINPADQRYLAAGSNISNASTYNKIYLSNDSGKTWTEKDLTSSLGCAGDPCVIYDQLGNLYCGHLSSPTGGYWLDRMVVQKSTNNGSVWSNGAGIGLNNPKNQDKEWLIDDRTNSQFRNNLYMSWTEFDTYNSSAMGDSTRILLSYSTDAGNGWSTPVKVSDKQGDCLDDDKTVEGAVPAVGPNGEVYVSWSGWNKIMFDKSLDGGKTFGRDIFVADQPGGWAFDIPAISRCNGLPITLCDISNSTRRGNVYIVWGDLRNGGDDADIFIIKSTDEGNTWGQTIKVNNDNSKKHQFFPWATIDQSTGYIYVVFYDRRNYSDYRTDVYLAVSKDGGESFQNFKISDTPFTPNKSIFFGDYTGIAAQNGKIYPIWMRLDGNTMSVWMARIEQKMVVGIDDEDKKSIPEGFELAQNYPNPFNPSTIISFTLPKQAKVTLKVYDLSGKELDTVFNGYKDAGTHKLSYDASKLSSGRYFYELKAGDVVITKKMIYQK